MISDS